MESSAILLNQLSWELATFDVAINDNNQLLVGDYDNNCIPIFTLDGVFISKIGTQYVTVVFIHSFGSLGSAEGQFHGCTGIALYPNGSIFISDSSNKRI